MYLVLQLPVCPRATEGNITLYRKISGDDGIVTEEVGQLSREFLDQSNHAIFYASWLRFLSSKFTQDGKNL